MRMVVLACVIGLGGCAAGGYCTGEFDYQEARSLPPLKEVEGLKVPESATGLRIPPKPKASTPYAVTVLDEEGDEQTRCLDMPPPMKEKPEDAAAQSAS